MSAAAFTAAIVAAQAGEKKQALLKRLTDAKAFNASDAVPLPSEDKPEELLADLIMQKVVRKVGDDRYFLDQSRQRDVAQGQGWQFMVMLLILGSIGASIAAILLT